MRLRPRPKNPMSKGEREFYTAHLHSAEDLPRREKQQPTYTQLFLLLLLLLNKDLARAQAPPPPSERGGGGGGVFTTEFTVMSIKGDKNFNTSICGSRTPITTESDFGRAAIRRLPKNVPSVHMFAKVHFFMICPQQPPSLAALLEQQQEEKEATSFFNCWIFFSPFC